MPSTEQEKSKLSLSFGLGKSRRLYLLLRSLFRKERMMFPFAGRVAHVVVVVFKASNAGVEQNG